MKQLHRMKMQHLFFIVHWTIYFVCYWFVCFVRWKVYNPFQWVYDIPTMDNTERAMLLLGTVLYFVVLRLILVVYLQTKNSPNE